MANCQISSLAGPSTSRHPRTEEIAAIPEGRVGQVCKQWLIREDGGLAYRLQNEEINQHYDKNRVKNRIVREDAPLARDLQKNELLTAQKIRSQYERYVNKRGDNDEQIARQIEHRLWLQDEVAKRQIQENDEKLAKKLSDKEKSKQVRKRLLKEKQQVKRLSVMLGVDYPIKGDATSCNTAIVDQDLDSFEKSSYQRILTEDDQEIDLSEFCMPPPPGLTPEEMKAFLEEQDAEIARLLQHQELKRNKNPEKEKLAVIEAQDREIAKLLQRQEKERAKRQKEKQRQKQLQQQLQQQHEIENSENFQMELTEPRCSYQRTSTPISPQNSFEESSVSNNPRAVEHDYDIPENHLVKDQSDHNETYEEPYQILSHHNDVAPPIISGNFYNIAIDLDPTYQRRVSKFPQAIDKQSVEMVETCVDDPEDTEVQIEHREGPSSTAGSGHIRNSLRALAKSHDSLTNALAKTRTSPTSSSGGPMVSTNSSRSSYTSNSSSSHLSSNRSHRSLPQPDNDYAPPLPPREGSLMARQSEAYSSNPILPPHHPQHPNRRNNSPFSFSSTGGGSPNRNSLYSVNNLPIQGQRRGASMEKPKKSKSKHKDDGCRTQ